MKAGRRKLLRLSADVDNYSDIVIVWNSKSRSIGYYDVEHQIMRICARLPSSLPILKSIWARLWKEICS